MTKTIRLTKCMTLLVGLTLLFFGCEPTKTTDNYVGQADKGDRTFKTNCAVCHNMQSQDAPTMFDLARSIPQRPNDWVVKYSLNSEKLYNEGDTIAKRLRQQYKDNRMTVFEGVLTEHDIKDIIAYLTRGPQP